MRTHFRVLGLIPIPPILVAATNTTLAKCWGSTGSALVSFHANHKTRHFTWSSIVWSIVYQQSASSQGKKPRVEWNHYEWGKRENRRRCRVGKEYWTSLLPVCVYMGTSDRLVSGLGLFHCGLWQLKNNTSREENRSSDSYYSYEWARGLSYCNFPSSSSFWKPIVPWERRIFCCCFLL